MKNTPCCTECGELMVPTPDAPGEWVCVTPACPACDMPVWIGGEVHPEDLGE